MDKIIKMIDQEIINSIDVKTKILNDPISLSHINSLCKRAHKTLIKGGQILLAGNGGSASDAQHIATEFVSKFEINRRALSARSLSTDTSTITAISNDYGYENLFSRQLEGIAKKNDFFIGITTSGNSKNILKALKFCNSNGIYSACLTSSLCTKKFGKKNIIIKVPSKITARIQECHILIGHIMCKYIEKIIFN